MKAIQGAAARAGYDKSRIAESERAWDSNNSNSAVTALVTYANANCGTSLRTTGNDGTAGASATPTVGGSGGDTGSGGGGSGGASGSSGGGSGSNGHGCGHGGWDGYGGGGCN